MATDNSNKKKADGKRISGQNHEQAYQSAKKKTATRTPDNKKAMKD